eukprot:TRINITY_DN6570_c0_g1_i2.p1 TRINITY_DN6570_c0_g1~~TRINITY_DN6570_c0_g1_i2.p1  ORF type:complete len:359 (+),score=94.90 TRINITY_DN6570_c0_g1_i2:307-1383(+)
MGDIQVRVCDELFKRLIAGAKERHEKSGGGGAGTVPRLSWYFGPTYSYGDFQDTSNNNTNNNNNNDNKQQRGGKLANKKMQYWRDINKMNAGWTFYFNGPQAVSPTITTHHISGMQQLWKKRKVVLWDNFPSNDYKPQTLFLHAYDGRDPALKDQLEGIVVNPMDRPEASLIPLSTVFEFLRHPQVYNPEQSLKSALKELLGGDEQIATDFFALIATAPSSVLRRKADITEVRKAQIREGRKYFLELKAALERAQAYLADSAEGSARLIARKKALSQELVPFFALLTAFCDMNSTQYEIQELLSLTQQPDNIQEQIHKARMQLGSLQQQLEALLQPVRQAKVLRAQVDANNALIAASN